MNLPNLKQSLIAGGAILSVGAVIALNQPSVTIKPAATKSETTTQPTVPPDPVVVAVPSPEPTTSTTSTTKTTTPSPAPAPVQSAPSQPVAVTVKTSTFKGDNTSGVCDLTYTDGSTSETAATITAKPVGFKVTIYSNDCDTFVGQVKS